MHHQADQEGDQENEEQDLGDTGRRKCDGPEAQQSSYKRHYQKDYCPIQHKSLLSEDSYNTQAGPITELFSSPAACLRDASPTPTGRSKPPRYSQTTATAWTGLGPGARYRV